MAKEFFNENIMSERIDPHAQVSDAVKNCTREQWMLAQTLSTAIRVANAPYCGGGPRLKEVAIEVDPKYIDHVAALVADDVSVTMLEDIIDLLSQARNVRQALDDYTKMLVAGHA